MKEIKLKNKPEKEEQGGEENNDLWTHLRKQPTDFLHYANRIH